MDQGVILKIDAERENSIDKVDPTKREYFVHNFVEQVYDIKGVN